MRKFWQDVKRALKLYMVFLIPSTIIATTVGLTVDEDLGEKVAIGHKPESLGMQRQPERAAPQGVNTASLSLFYTMNEILERWNENPWLTALSLVCVTILSCALIFGGVCCVQAEYDYKIKRQELQNQGSKEFFQRDR